MAVSKVRGLTRNLAPGGAVHFVAKLSVMPTVASYRPRLYRAWLGPAGLGRDLTGVRNPAAQQTSHDRPADTGGLSEYARLVSLGFEVIIRSTIQGTKK